MTKGISSLQDKHFHGTHVASIIAGSGVASDGTYRGLAPDATLISLKISTNAGDGYSGDVAAGIHAAIEAGVDVINYSASFSPSLRVGPPPWVWASTSPIEKAFAIAAEAGILCVVAAGNDGWDATRKRATEGSINRPGGAEQVVTVGNFDDTHLALDSSRGPYRVLPSLAPGGYQRYDSAMDLTAVARQKPDVAAPGCDVGAACTSTPANPHVVKSQFFHNGVGYIRVSGTSQATAVITGLSACLIQYGREKGLDFGADPSRLLKGILLRGTKAPIVKNETGAGVAWWPAITDICDGCISDPGFRLSTLSLRRWPIGI